MRVKIHYWPLFCNIIAMVMAISGNFVLAFIFAMIAQVHIEFR